MASKKPQPFGDQPGNAILSKQAGVALSEMFTGEIGKTQVDKECDALRKMCRAGNPFPLIGYQWPALLVTDPAERAFFSEIPAGGLDFVTPGIRAAVSRERNPVLRLDWWQKIILAGFFDPTIGEIFIKGCTGAGKGASVGIANCLWYDVYDESRITLTGRDYSHAILNIFGEVKQWFMQMRYPSFANVLGEGIAAGERHYIRVLNPDPSSATAGEAYSGAHGRNTLYTFDEATSSPDTFFENAEKNARKICALANPRTTSGRFRDAFRPLGQNENKIATCYGILGNRLCVTISGEDCMNVRYKRLKNPVAPAGGITISGKTYNAGDRVSEEHHEVVKPLISNQIDLNQFKAICSKGDQRLVDVFAFGKFPQEDPELQIILRSWLPFHLEAHKLAPPKVEAFGLDVARSQDGDQTCLASGGQDGCHSLQFWQYSDLNKLCGSILSHVRETHGIELNQCRNPITVDCDGLGAGAADILRAAGCWVIEYRGNAGAEIDRGAYGNLRAEGYAVLGRRLNPDDRWRGKPWALPNHENMLQELCAPEKVYSSDGLRFHITPKSTPPGKENIASIKSKLKRSPDAGDAVVYLFHAVRAFHNLNEWFEASTRELISYPRANDKVPPDPTEKPPELPPDIPITAMLREEYGKLLKATDQQVAPDWMPGYKKQVEEQRERDRKLREAEEASKPTPQAPTWHSQIWGDD